MLIGARDRLNAYCDTINSPIGGSGITRHALFGEWLNLKTKDDGGGEMRLELPAGSVKWSRLDYRTREQAISELQAQLSTMGVPSKHPFWGSALTSYASTDAGEFRRAFNEAMDALRKLREATAILAEKLSLTAPDTLQRAESLAAAVERAIRAPEHSGVQFSSGQWLARRPELLELIRLGTHMADLKSRHGSALIPEAWERNVLETRQAISEHGSKWFKFAIGDWRSAQKEMRLLCSGAPLAEASKQIELLDAIQDYQRTRTRFAETSALGATLFAAQWQGEHSNWAVLSQLLEWIASVHEEVGNGKLPKAFVDFLSGAADLATLEPDSTAVAAATKLCRELGQSAVRLLDIRDSSGDDAAAEFMLEAFDTQEARFASWEANVGRLQQMSVFNHIAAACRALELDAAVDFVSVTSREGQWIVSAFRRGYIRSLLQQLFADHPEIANFSGVVHERTAEQFREVDVRLLENNRVALASLHWQSISRLNGALGLGGGEVRILTREFEKKIRLLPIRQLLATAGHAVQAIKPVFMMSPLSVATFLAPGHLKFDLVVFDEASQVKPIDALGALARGTQAVVVGDSKQLPPTSFFDSIALSDLGAVDDDNQTADMESVLGLFVGQGAPQRMLKWHYRSRHESLIAVSNQEFYENKLVVFPSPDAARERTGLVYNYLPDTVYDRGSSGTNRLEAKKVAEAAVLHAREQLAKQPRERKTLGVAAFSMGQMERIQEQLEVLRRQNPDCESFFNAASHEPFFVKNLENVQGDERDVIFISVGYGRDKAGNVSMNFGPLNKVGGERRLNVLISRARERCVVFTNLLPDDIDLSRTAARGVASFKTFLTFAHSAGAALPGPIEGRAETTVFEEQVRGVLEDVGHVVVPQVGCAGYFVDLAIADPKRPGAYILGIECDGPNYRSARSARDRDRLRQDVLTKMGWQLHRVWSPDWVHRYEDEVAKLVHAADEARDAARAQTPIEPAEALPPAHPANAASEDIALSVDDPFESVVRRAETEVIGFGDEPIPHYVITTLPVERDIDINDRYAAKRIADLLQAIVLTEGPIHWTELARRLAGALAISRLTESFQAKVRVLAANAERDGLVRIEDQFLWPPLMREPPLRDRSLLDSRSRSIDLVAPEEIALAVKRVVGSAYAISADDLARPACKLLGFDRVSGESKEYVDTVVAWMIETGQVVADRDVVRIASAPLPGPLPLTTL